ncbi:uncharacterized protein LOC114756595 [Neltuma alba]|uniref:uncharacterized protein LOC114756595 n=1 Tax=Neltuma alba TaxID=207710 RepID=UPI0010A4AED7|nr:uncharacterized protein LOC114756595 [Prosopis alba]
MISIGIKKHQPECPSLQIMEAPKEIEKHMDDVRREGVKESEIQEIVDIKTLLLTPCVGFQHVLNFHNLRQITILKNQKLKTLFSVSTCRNLSQLSQLDVWSCEELVNVVEDDSNHHHHHDMNNSSIFPKLEDLRIDDCNKLEFIFPLSLSGTLQKLKYLSIWKTAELKYIFGKYDDGDHLSNTIHLPALETLSLRDVPKLINNIGAKKYHLSFPPLRSIDLQGLQEFNGRSFTDLVAYLQGIQLNVKAPKDLMKIIKDMQKLTTLDVRDSKIEEVLNLEGVEIEGPFMTLSIARMRLENLCELRHIFRRPKYILSLPNLQELNIIACKKLTVIFCVSIVRNLPQLSYLSIRECDELVDIIEESDGDHLHQLYFPKLKGIDIKCCNSLKFLFSISTCGMFPKLVVLQIEEASELEQIFMCKQDNMQKMAKMGEFFPKLSIVTLRKLPRLISICKGIDFKDLQHCRVEDCQKYPETGQMTKEPKNGDSENQSTSSVLPEVGESSEEAMKTSVEEVASSMITQSIKEITESSLQENYATEDAMIAILSTNSNSRKQSTIPFVNSRNDSVKESEDERSTCEATSLGQQQDLGQTKISINDDDLTKKDSGRGTVMTNQQARTEKTSASVESFQEKTTTMEAKIDTSSFYSHGKASQSGPSMMVAGVEECVKHDLQKHDSSNEDEVAIQSSNLELMKRPRGSSHMLFEKESSQTAKETRGINVPMKNNTSLPDGIPSSGHRKDLCFCDDFRSSFCHVLTFLAIYLSESQTGITDSSSPPILEIGEILQLVALKDDEPALLAKALEQYPELKLSRGQRTHQVIAFSYRVLTNILVMLVTKTPRTITTSDKLTLEENLGTATFLGFDKGWIESVRDKVFGKDMFDVTKVEEEMQKMKEELEARDIMLEQVRKRRVEIEQQIAGDWTVGDGAE